jgi:hypothetical protein
VGRRRDAIGDLAHAETRRVVNAAGLTVAPGFIDTHTHPETVRYLLMVLVLLIGPFDSLATARAQRWLLLEPPVDGTSELANVLDEAPIAQWNRIGTYDTEGTCEARRNEAGQGD